MPKASRKAKTVICDKRKGADESSIGYRVISDSAIVVRRVVLSAMLDALGVNTRSRAL